MKLHYPDARGVWHEGQVVKISDFGGTDVTYWFRDSETNELTLRRLSAVDCKHAHAVYGPEQGCPVCDESYKREKL